MADPEEDAENDDPRTIDPEWIDPQAEVDEELKRRRRRLLDQS
ncbi:MAG TPA: hypothetical protein VF444_10000 [Pseudonocardiaceae bacterium]